MTYPVFPASINRNVIATAITNRFAALKVTAVQFVANVAPVSFADAAGSSPVPVDRPVLVLIWRRMVRLLIRLVGTIISRIHLALTLSLILIKIVLINNVMLNKVVLILSKVLGTLNKVLMWNKVRVI